MSKIENSRIPELLHALKSQTLLHKLALGVEFLIKQRTQKGFDLFGQTFLPYSDAYKKKRESHNLNVWPVDLFWDHTQGMLTKIDHVVANNFDSVRVLINDPEKELIGSYHDRLGAGKNKVIRRWWGIHSDDEKNRLSRLGFNAIKAIIKSL